MQYRLKRNQWIYYTTFLCSLAQRCSAMLHKDSSHDPSLRLGPVKIGRYDSSPTHDSSPAFTVCLLNSNCFRLINGHQDPIMALVEIAAGPASCCNVVGNLVKEWQSARSGRTADFATDLGDERRRVFSKYHG